MSRLGLRPIKPPVQQLLIFSSGKVAWHGTKDMFQWHIIHHKTHIDYCLVKPCPLMRSLWLTLCSMSFIYYWLSKSQCLKITQGINCVNFLREGIGVVLYECSRNGRAELGMMRHITCLVWTERKCTWCFRTNWWMWKLRNFVFCEQKPTFITQPSDISISILALWHQSWPFMF